jgi:hypothetical protein
MKIVLSRKGFDSESGKIPNPIMPDGRLCPLPIPYPRDRIRLGNVAYGNERLSDIVGCLTNRFDRETVVHLDPDLQHDARPRRRGWRPTFGQHHIAQTHLENQGVGPGDLFLFFGRFRQTIIRGTNGLLAFQNDAPIVHLLFGWLQVHRLVRPDDNRRVARIPNWLRQHPHILNRRQYDGNNTVYVATRRLTLSDECLGLPGGGVFPRFFPALRLTRDLSNTSHWRLPAWLYPNRGRPPLSYHESLERWRRRKTYCELRSVAKGQEFVLDCDYYPEANNWLREIFRCIEN